MNSRIERIISGLLRWCVVISLGLLTAGIAFSFSMEDTGDVFIIPGLLLLIATPVMRVAVSIVAFIVEKDWIFVGITTTVFVFLLLSFLLGM